MIFRNSQPERVPAGRRVARVFAVAAILAVAACAVEEDLSESERALLLTEVDFQPAQRPTDPATPAGTFRKTVGRLDRSRELIYEFKKEGSGFYLSNTLRVEPSAPNALLVEGGQRIGLLIGLKTTSITEEPLPARAKYGDRASLSLLRSNGVPVGNVFSVVGGKNVYAIVLVGVHFDDAEAFDRALGPRIDAVLKYDPR
jgi:hypothetical protein